MKRILGLSILLSALVVLASTACGGSDDGSSSSKPTSTQTRAATTTTPSLGSQSTKVEVRDFSFNPKELTAEADKPFTVELTNSGSVSHTFSVEHIGFDQVLAAGDTKTVTFTPTGVGTVTFYCRFHRTSNGMEGTLNITPVP